MIATLERIEILEKAEELSAMILQSDLMENYYSCLYKVRNSEEAQKKIKAFLKAKEQYEEVERFGRYHPDYYTVMRDIRSLKREMDMDEDVANFKVAENELQALLDEISFIIGHSVSKNIKVPTGNPFFDQGNHGGGCGTGGSCGCSI